MQTPEFMPVLKGGPHDRPEQGACLMEYISVLAGEGFTDRPACTHRALALMSQSVNDMALDADRHLLIPLIPRLMRTGGAHPWDEMSVVPTYEARFLDSYKLPIDHEVTVAGVQILSDMIDEYWRVLGQPEPQDDELTTADYELMVTAVKQ